jgi:hypothetical protein
MAQTFETTKLQAACQGDQDILNKLATIATDGPSYGTPGPKSLGPHARHAHVTNISAIAWTPTGQPIGADQHILAIGTKSGQAGKFDSGYKWSKTGK